MNPDHPARRGHPSKLFVETTSRCNLNCFMCVKQTRDNGIHDGDLAPATFEALRPTLPHLEALLLNGIGEPLLHPRLEDFIRQAREEVPADCRIGFQTNALLLTDRRALALARAGVDRVCLSLDSISPENFRKVREGGELSSVESALASLAAAGREAGREIRAGVEFVLMRENLHELPDALRWAASRGAAFAIVTHLIPYDGAHADQAAYQACTDAAIEHFERWREKARREGVDLLRYFDVLWKYGKTPEEKRIVETVREMKSEGERRGLSLDLKKLIALDRSRTEALSSVFEEAREVARATGLGLRLPEAVPRQERRCDFIEDGGAFVSWDGEVHPCYFLWHGYNCHAGGWNQKVRPRSFGNLRGTGILEVWNSPDFRGFRESVLAYDHPSCTSCSVAPCDYVQTDDFEHDCHIKGEPCGSCLWCTGLFHCLR